ncbi:hypothetical protein BFW87_27775 [Pseudomonas fluorescens]|uniref:Uncharacterized protein n=1 Tax=Pseudomonas fluorescens TaxID=294 RepID=A0A1T2XZK2_PSEFL|nr:glycosyltransferase [Pseudomonas fluorescens]OPA85233.1 hypothetical protein BFW87_27775 [Pseudomonas fluorescens]
MLNPDNTCTLPNSQLQPSAPPYIIKIPEVVFFAENTVLTEFGYMIPVFYDVQHELWRSTLDPDTAVWLTAKNQWRSGAFSYWQSVRETLPRPTRFRDIVLPSYPVLPVATQEIPRQIHHIWIGTSMPGPNIIDTIMRNTANTADFTVTLHTDVGDELFATLKNRLKQVAPNMTVTQLNGTAFFDQFKTTDIHKHYVNASTGTVTNYSAASDMLRYPLANHYGGIYMDVDDSFSHTLSEHSFLAADNDVLLGPLINHYGADFTGYNSSIFASASNNPVLAKVTEEMTRRCDNNADFFIKPRLQVTDQSSPEFKEYATELFSLTGPQVLNDVLASERPDYYRTLFNLSQAYGPLAQHSALDTAYAAELTRIAEHYFPFFEKAPVEIGKEHSWVST